MFLFLTNLPPPRSYAAIFKHAKDELGFCYYLIPCGNKATNGQCGNCTVRLEACCLLCLSACWARCCGWVAGLLSSTTCTAHCKRC